MKTIYLDEAYCCHLSAEGTVQAVETDLFDVLCDGAVSCYRLIPAGQAWTGPDGRVLSGPFVQAVVSPDAIQRQHEADEAAHLEELGALIEEIYNEDMEEIANV